MDPRPNNYDIASAHLDALAPLDSGSFDSNRTTHAQIHALLAIADEVRRLREETAAIASVLAGLESNAGGLRHLFAYLEKLAGKQPD